MKQSQTRPMMRQAENIFPGVWVGRGYPSRTSAWSAAETHLVWLANTSPIVQVSVAIMKDRVKSDGSTEWLWKLYVQVSGEQVVKQTTSIETVNDKHASINDEPVQQNIESVRQDTERHPSPLEEVRDAVEVAPGVRAD